MLDLFRLFALIDSYTWVCSLSTSENLFLMGTIKIGKCRPTRIILYLQQMGWGVKLLKFLNYGVGSRPLWFVHFVKECVTSCTFEYLVGPIRAPRSFRSGNQIIFVTAWLGNQVTTAMSPENRNQNLFFYCMVQELNFAAIFMGYH